MNVRNRWNNLRRLHKYLVVSVVILIIYGCIGFFLVPVIVRSVAQSKLSDALNRKTTITDVNFNPFTLNLEIRGLVIKHKRGPGNLFAFKRLEANFEIVSLFKLAPIVSFFRLEGPHFDFTRFEDNTFDFHDILEKPSGGEVPAGKNQKRPLFSINNIQIEDGKITFHDKVTKTEHVIKDISISLPFVSDLPHAVKIFHEPHVRATIDGAKVAFEGKAKPFYVSRETHLNIKLSDLDLSRFAKYFPMPAHLSLVSGRFSSDLTVSFEQRPGTTPVVSLNGKIGFKGVRIDRDGHGFLSVRLLTLEVKPSNFLEKKIHVKKISVQSPRVIYALESNKRSERKSAPEWNSVAGEGFRKLKRKLVSEAEKAINEAPDVQIDSFELSGGEFDFEDRTLEKPFLKRIKGIEFRATGLSTRNITPASFQLSCGEQSGENLSAEGSIGVKPVQLDASISLKNVSIPSYYPYYEDHVKGSVTDGRISIFAKFHVIPVRGGKHLPAVNITDMKFLMDNFTLLEPGGDGEVISIKNVTVNGDIFDPDHGSLVISDVLASGAFARVIRDEKGQLNLGNIINREAEITGGTEKTETSPETRHQTMPLKIMIKNVAVGPVDIDFTDKTLPSDQNISLSSLTLNATDIDLSKDKDFHFTLKGGTIDHGHFAISGTALSNGTEASADISFDTIPVTIANGYIGQFLNARFTRGNISLKGKAAFKRHAEKLPSITFKGKFIGSNIVAIDTLESKKISTWKSIKLLGIDLRSLSPLQLTIDKFLVDRHFELVELDKKGQLNITRIFKLIRKKGGKHENISRQASGTDEKMRININLFQSTNGTVKFIDRSVSPVFLAKLTRINAVFKGLSNKPGTTADVKIEGIINSNARMLINGKANPMVEPRYLNLTLKIENFGMNRLSPYTAKYIGYLVSKGKLNMDVNLLLAGDTIDATDNVFLNQFTLGEKAESKTATGLPVKMAVSLLTDKRGHIKLNIPIKGNINDPKFSVGSVVFRIIRNLIIKVATSPFSILSAAFGGGGEDLQYVKFEPGKAEIPESQIKKLDVLAKTMNNHPNIKIELTGNYDPVADREAMEKEKFNMLLKQAKYNDLSKKERKKITPEHVEILPEEYEKYLKKAWKKAPIKKERNFLMLIKKQPVPVMEKMLKDYCAVKDEDLKVLAIERVEKVENYLVKVGKIDPKRVFTVSPGSKKAKDSSLLTSVLINIK